MYRLPNYKRATNAAYEVLQKTSKYIFTYRY